MEVQVEPTADGRPLSAGSTLDADVLDRIAQRVLWLSTAMVDAANRGRPNPSGVKVGGHQASSASMVGIMTSLWFAELGSLDRVSVRPHAAPALHAINFLLLVSGVLLSGPACGATTRSTPSQRNRMITAPTWTV